MAESYISGPVTLFYGKGEDSWWGWLQTAKDKVVSQSSEVLEFVKNDIDEFTKVVTEETSAVVSSTASALKNKLKLDEEDSAANNVKKSVSGFLSHVAEVFTPPPDDEDEEAFVITNQEPVMLSRLQANIYTHVQDPKTFLQDPADEADYNSWLETFDMESKQVEMADLLVTCKPLHKHFSNLVPTEVSHSLFWHRYFYLVHRLQKQEDKRKEISSRAVSGPVTEEEIVWEDDELLSGAELDIPEDVQTKLLQDYEDELLSASSSSEQISGADDEGSSPQPSTPGETHESSAPPSAKPEHSHKQVRSVAMQQPKSIINEQKVSTKSTVTTKEPTAKNNVKSNSKSKVKAQNPNTKKQQSVTGKQASGKTPGATQSSKSSATSTPTKSLNTDERIRDRSCRTNHRGAHFNPPPSVTRLLPKQVADISKSSFSKDCSVSEPLSWFDELQAHEVLTDQTSLICSNNNKDGSLTVLEDMELVMEEDILCNDSGGRANHTRIDSCCSDSLSGDSNEEEWEKVDATDSDSGVVSTHDTNSAPSSSTAVTPASPSSKPKGEDWETWE